MPKIDPAALDDALLERGWSDAELARRVPVSKSHLSSARRGSKGLSNEKLRAMARLLRIPVRNLVRRDAA